MPDNFQVQLINATKQYSAQKVQALRDVSLVINKGEFIALRGPSGCGKSTLLNLISGIDRADSGEIIVSGQKISAMSEEELALFRRSTIGFVFQFFNLLTTLTVFENIALPLDLNGKTGRKEIEKKVELLLSELKLADKGKSYPSQLSGGEMQRVAIMRAVIHNPELVLADEPTGNLDTESGKLVMDLLSSVCRERGHTVIMATHSQEASAACDRVIEMKDGQIIAEVRQ